MSKTIGRLVFATSVFTSILTSSYAEERKLAMLLDFYLKCVGKETYTWKDGVKTQQPVEEYYHIRDRVLYKLLELDFLVAQWEPSCSGKAICVVDDGKIEVDEESFHLIISRLNGAFSRLTSCVGGVTSTSTSGRCVKVDNPKPAKL
jgi:hypothetical protein